MRVSNVSRASNVRWGLVLCFGAEFSLQLQAVMAKLVE